MLTRAERKAKLKALGDARAKKAAAQSARQAGAKSPGSTPRHMAPGGQRFDARPPPPATDPTRRLLEGGHVTAGELVAPPAAASGSTVASRPPTPRRLSKQLNQLREMKEAAARAQQLRDAAAARQTSSPLPEGTPHGQAAAPTASHHIVFSSQPPQEIVAELSPRTIRRELGSVRTAPAARRVLKPITTEIQAQLAAALSEHAAEVPVPHPLLDALHNACEQGDVSTIELLAQRGASVKEKDTVMGWSAIHYACDHPAAISAVLRLGGDANAEDDYHMTALHLAAENGSYEAVRMLSKLNRRRRGSIEYLASKKGHYDICELLQKRWSGAPDSDDDGDAAEFEFTPQEPGDLGMKVGDIVVLTEALAEKKWWVGYQENDVQRRMGEFPSNYVRVLQATPTPAPKASGGGLRAVSNEDLAAVKLQAQFRGHRVRRRRRVADQRWRAENCAATSIQSRWRGHQTRRRMPAQLPDKKARPPPLPTASHATVAGSASHSQPRPHAPPLPPHQADAEIFAAKAAAWDEMQRYSPTHDSPRSASPSPPGRESSGFATMADAESSAGPLSAMRTNRDVMVANARDDEEARVREAMAALDELERTRGGVVEPAQLHPAGALSQAIDEQDPAAKRRLFLMAHSEPGESPVFLTRGGVAEAAASQNSPRSTLSLSPAATEATPVAPAATSSRLGVAMAAARGRHEALEALLAEQAAVVIQAAVRGRQTRRRLPPALPGSPCSRSPLFRSTPLAGTPPHSPISPSSPGREARATASMQLNEALASLSVAEARAESLQLQLSQAESALVSQSAAVERDGLVREETKAQLQATLAARMGERAGVNCSRRLANLAFKSWRAQVAERNAEERHKLDAAFSELERSVSTYREEASGRADRAEVTHARMQARLAELEASLASSKEAEANAQAELETVRAKAAQLGSAMQSRVVAAEAETESCRSDLQAAMRDQEDRHATRVEGLKAELQELRVEASAKVVAEANTHAELSALRGVDNALKEALARENELRARHVMLESTQEERSRRTEAVRKAEKLEQQKSLASQMSLETLAAELEQELTKVSKEFKSYMTARYLLTIRRMASCKVAAALHSWRAAQLRAARARGTVTRAVGRFQYRGLVRCYEQWSALADQGSKHRASHIRFVNGKLKLEQRRLYLRTLLHWARQAKNAKYERGEEARLAALASCAAMDEQMFSLRAEVAALMQDKEEATFSLERLRSSSNSARSVDIQVRSGSHSKSEQSADNRSRESERVAALEARLKQADEHIHQLVTHGASNPTFTRAEAKRRRQQLLQRAIGRIDENIARRHLAGWRAVVKEWNYTRQAEADLTASRETIEELLIVNSRHAEQARVAVAAQATAVPILSGAGVSSKMRPPRGTSSAVEYSRYRRTSSSSSAAAARIASRSSSGVTPMTRRAQRATALLSSDDSDDDVTSIRHSGVDVETGD